MSGEQKPDFFDVNLGVFFGGLIFMWWVALSGVWPGLLWGAISWIVMIVVSHRPGAST